MRIAAISSMIIAALWPGPSDRVRKERGENLERVHCFMVGSERGQRRRRIGKSHRRRYGWFGRPTGRRENPDRVPMDDAGNSDPNPLKVKSDTWATLEDVVKWIKWNDMTRFWCPLQHRLVRITTSTPDEKRAEWNQTTLRIVNNTAIEHQTRCRGDISRNMLMLFKSYEIRNETNQNRWFDERKKMILAPRRNHQVPSRFDAIKHKYAHTKTIEISIKKWEEFPSRNNWLDSSGKRPLMARLRPLNDPPSQLLSNCVFAYLIGRY